MGHAMANFFLALPSGALGRSQKFKYHLISITKSISKIFLPNFVCVLTNEKYKTYHSDFHSIARVMPQGRVLRALGCPGGQKKSKYGHEAYQIDGDDKQNRMLVKFSS